MVHQPYQQPPPYPPYQQPQYQGPARTAHGASYWLAIGWWLEPMAWMMRMMFSILTLGWINRRHGRKMAEARQRRGYR